MSLEIAQQATLARGRGRGRGSGGGRGRVRPDPNPNPSQATLAVQNAIGRYDGTITRLLTDDKGTRFLIAFGLPGHQHDNDEERAVLSSLEVVAALDAIPAWAAEGEARGSKGSVQAAVGISP